MTTTTATSRRARGPEYFPEPQISRWIFGSSSAAWIWLVARLWLGWEWFQAGWGKVFGGNITWKIWDWGDAQYSLTGDHNIGWIRSSGDTGVGDAVAGFAKGAIAASEGEHPDVAYSWYVEFLEWIRDTAHPVLGVVVSFGELFIGIALILGLLTGIAAFFGSILNFTFIFAGTSGVNPAMLFVAGALILAWRNAGWYGLDRWALPRLGTPWEPGEVFRRTNGGRDDVGTPSQADRSESGRDQPAAPQNPN